GERNGGNYAKAEGIPPMSNSPTISSENCVEARSRRLEPEQVTVLDEEVVRRAMQRLPVETLQRIGIPIGLTAVAEEQHRARSRLIREEIVAVQRTIPHRQRRLSIDDERIVGAILVPQIVGHAQIVLADQTQEDRPRQLVLELETRDHVASDETVVGPAPVILIVESAFNTRTITRPDIQRKLDQIDVRLRPLVEVLVVPADVEQVGVEDLPLRRRQREDVIVIGDARPAGEGQQLSRRRLDLVAGV